MFKYILLAVLLGMLASNSVCADESMSDYSVHHSIKIDRLADNSLLLSLTDYQYLYEGDTYSYQDLFGGIIHFNISDQDPMPEEEPIFRGFTILEKYADIDYLGYFDWKKTIEQGAPFQGLQLSTDEAVPLNTPLVRFNYEGPSDVFYVDDPMVGYTARIPVPAAVPEPATLLGFGLPMLMLGLGKIRQLKK